MSANSQPIQPMMSAVGTFIVIGLSTIAIFSHLVVLVLYGGFTRVIWPILACWIWVIAGLIAMKLVSSAQLKKAAANLPQVSHQVQTVDPPSSLPPYQQQSGDIVSTTTGSNTHNENCKRLLRKAHRGVILRTLIVGIMPGAALLGLFIYFYVHYYTTGDGDDNCKSYSSKSEMTTCSFIHMVLISGFFAVPWLFLVVIIRRVAEWRRWNELYFHDGEIELGHARAQNLQK